MLAQAPFQPVEGKTTKNRISGNRQRAGLATVATHLRPVSNQRSAVAEGSTRPILGKRLGISECTRRERIVSRGLTMSNASRPSDCRSWRRQFAEACRHVAPRATAAPASRTRLGQQKEGGGGATVAGEPARQEPAPPRAERAGIAILVPSPSPCELGTRGSSYPWAPLAESSGRAPCVATDPSRNDEPRRCVLPSYGPCPPISQNS